MNPASPYFNLKNAELTPQYVDIFIEMKRLELLKVGLKVDLSHAHDLFLSSEGNYGTVIYMYRKPGSFLSFVSTSNTRHYTHAQLRVAQNVISINMKIKVK